MGVYVLSEITLNSIEYMRYLETIVNICAKEDAHMEYGISVGAIDLVSDGEKLSNTCP